MSILTSATETSASSAAQTRSRAESLISSDFDTWLNLLTAQLRNQDPYDPVDSTEYTAQLAQFSAVEQQVQTNDLLTELISLTTSSDMASMANWVGMRVRVAAPAAYQGDPVTVSASTDPTANSAQLVITDGNGKEVNRISIPTGDSYVEWSGLDSSGDAVSWGTYAFSVESFDTNGALLSSETAEVYADVVEVQRSDGLIMLVLADGTMVSSNDVSAVSVIGT